MLYIVQYVLCILIRQLILQYATGLTPDSFLNCNIYHKITHRKDFPFYSIKSKRIAFVITSPTLSLRKNINYVQNYVCIFFLSRQQHHLHTVSLLIYMWHVCSISVITWQVFWKHSPQNLNFSILRNHFT